ncbi:AAA family ATPase [Mycoplasma buteonis]|uniref:AAA family ATPase n=1 Tax=Mycoplasma buteonis TaxID=171280 RepID=UPI00056AEAC8|nr:AAA family ATPase [Mycoplasma buteonis]
MKLVKIEAHGFKSFADPIVLRFDGGVAGIVGPNGSGKSNINDAIRWVLGEQSSKELRGDSMEDVIFSGSKTVQPMNRATVTLTFDNRERNSSINTDYITITRSLERGKGTNEYFLNGEPCRHKDIKAIAMESGIGKSSLAIISQGTVADIAQSSDEQRRLIFEEAAGVSKYKLRKTEALRKLERTESTLKQIEAVIKELQKRLEPLRKQAEKALAYKDKNKQLREVEIAYLASEIVRLEKLYQELHEDLAGVEDTKRDYRNQIDQFLVLINEKRTELNNLSSELAQLRGQREAINLRLGDLKVTQARENERRDMIARGEIQASSDEKIEALISSIKEMEHKINYFKTTKYDLEVKMDASNSLLVQLKKQINEQYIIANDAERKIENCKTHLGILLEKKNKHTNLFKGTKTIVENKLNFKGFKGLVSDLIKVQPDYVTAIETVLANAVQHVVVDRPDTAVEAVNFLKKNNGGRATFIPLSSIKEKFVRDDYLLVVRNYAGFIGLASELVDTKPEYNTLKSFLLGNVIVVDDIKSAEKISNILDKKYMVVTLDGDIVRVGGIIVGGTAQESDDNLGIENKIKDLQNLIPGLESIKNNATTNILKLKNQLQREETFNKQHTSEFATINVHLANSQTQLDEYKAHAAQLNAQKQIQEEKIDITPLLQKVQELENQVRLIDFEIKTKSKIEDDLRGELAQLENDKNKTTSMLLTLNDSFNQKIKLYENSKFYLEKHKERLSQYYKLTLEYARENFALSMSLESAKELISELRSEIEALGNVNLESITELEEVEARYDNFSENFEELTDARNTILSAIAEMDKIIITRLTNIVNDVNKEFSRVFSSMFGGGTAEVKFVDQHNVLESGISIYAQPPGKSIKNLKLFSGGEKSLIAISLLFAILRARPLPLCILDEVEAALDESNVVRYGEYLQELKKQTQFLVITHRVGTMTKVDALFGATMQTRGVTSFFSVKLEDAKQMVENDK